MTKSAYADYVGVSGSAISKATKKDGQLEHTLVGKKIDSGHRDALIYWESKQESVTISVNGGKPQPFEPHHIEPYEIPTPSVSGTAARKETMKRATQIDPSSYEVPQHITEYADMTLRDIISRHGTDVMFLDWLKATKEIENISEKRLKNAHTEGELVSRHLVKVGVIDPIDSVHTKLLTDGAKTIARRSIAMHEAGRSAGEIEKFVSEQMTSFIRPVKAKIAKALKNV